MKSEKEAEKAYDESEGKINKLPNSNLNHHIKSENLSIKSNIYEWIRLTKKIIITRVIKKINY